jgi:8-oxo-dGTP pyrophosphatase MutT (NUDIX family)
MLFDIEDYNNRVELAMCFDEDHGLIKKFYGYDSRLSRIQESLFSYQSLHSFGIIHMTADIFLILPDRNIIIQKRSSSVDIPETFGPSAGGHSEYNQSPRDTIIEELHEELGLKLSIDRINCVLPNEQPIENYFFRNAIRINRQNQIIQKFRPDGHWYTDNGFYLETKTFELSRNRSKTSFFNQELAFFFYSLIDFKELEAITPNKGEICEITKMDVLSLRNLISDHKYESDSLFILNNSNLCDHLQNV